MGGILKVGCIAVLAFVLLVALLTFYNGPGDSGSDSAYLQIDIIKIDSQKVAELMPFFTIQEDEFDKVKWYSPKSAPKNVGYNGIYCSFAESKGRIGNFHFSIQYVADDWLFINRVDFLIDSITYKYIPNEIESEVGNGGQVMEWFSDRMDDASDLRMIRALASSEDAKMRLVGDQFQKIKPITKAQIKDISRTLELYKAMGGEL